MTVMEEEEGLISAVRDVRGVPLGTEQPPTDELEYVRIMRRIGPGEGDVGAVQVSAFNSSI